MSVLGARRRWMAAGLVGALLLAVGWGAVRVRRPVPHAPSSSAAQAAPLARLRTPSGSQPWLLVDGAFASATSAFAVGDAGVGPRPQALPCPVLAGIACAGDGFVMVSTDGGRSWRQAYKAPGLLEGLSAWPGGGAVVWGPTTLAGTTVGAAGWRELPKPGPGDILWASFASPTDGWVALRTGCTANHGLLAGCADAVFATSDGGQRWEPIARTQAYAQSAPGAKLLGRQVAGGRYSGDGQGWLADATAAYRTTDAGRTWTSLPGMMQGASAAMASPRRGFRLSDTVRPGQDSTTTDLLETADGGRVWSPVARIGQVVTGLRIGRDGSLWAVATQHRAVGAPGWACASTVPACGPAVWVSADGGRTWSDHPTPGTAVAWLAPLDASHALAGAYGPDGRPQILLTADGGQSWQPSVTTGPPPAPTLRVGFWSASRGWGYGAPGIPGAVLFTADGGRTWARAGDVPPGTYDAAFTDQQHGFAQAGTQAWEITSDGGRTWQAPPQRPPGAMLWGFNLGTLGSSGASVLMSSPGAAEPVAALTLDRGQRWTRIPVPPNTAALRMATAASGWAVQPAPAAAAGAARPPAAHLLYTADGGRTWRSVLNLGDTGAVPLISSPGPGQVWAVEPDGPAWTLLRTDDAGAHWMRYTLPPPLADDLFAGDTLSAVSPSHAWLLTRGGLWRTRDGGASWTRVTQP